MSENVTVKATLRITGHETLRKIVVVRADGEEFCLWAEDERAFSAIDKLLRKAAEEKE